MVKKFICIGVISLFVALLMEMEGKNSRMITSPTPGEFPIVASTVFNNLTGPQQGDLDGIMECGFNVCMHSSTVERFDLLLKYMSGTNLKLLLHNESFLYANDGSNLVAFVNRFKDNPHVAGWEFYDEPKWSELSELAKRFNLLLKTDNTHFTLINLVGEVIESHTGPCKTLPEYLDSIQKIFPMDVWSSDCYPIWVRNGQFLVRYKDFYTDLEAYANKSKETGLPMWSYCESMAFTSKHHDIPAATLSYLSFEAFSALAYGAQGIVYWTYWQRPSNSYETYLSALVDLDGNKTPAWYAAQSVNRQIRALTPVFLGATMEDVRHSGNIPLKDARPFISNFGPIDRLTNGDKGVLVSHISNDGKDYIVIVNHDVQEKQNIRLKFKREFSNITEIRASVSGKMIRETVSGLQKVTLPPGGYIIYQWHK